MKRFLKPAGSLISTALFTSVAIDGLSFVNQASANPNPDASRQTSESEKPNTQADVAASPPGNSVTPPEAALVQKFSPTSAKSAPFIAHSGEAGAEPTATGQDQPGEAAQTSQNEVATGQEQPDETAQTSQNKVAKLADLIAGAQRRITAEEASNLLGQSADSTTHEALMSESTTTQNETTRSASSEDSLSAANASSEAGDPENVSESQPRLVEHLTAITDQKQPAEKVEQPQALMAEALTLAESGQIDQARRIVQDARLIPAVQTTVLAKIDDLEAQQLNQPQPTVAGGGLTNATRPQETPAAPAAWSVAASSVPLQRICPPLALNPTVAALSKPTAVNPLPTTEAAQSPDALKRLDSPMEDIKPDFSAAIKQYYPFPPNQAAHVNGTANGALHQHSLPEIGQRLNSGLTSSRLMRSHAVLTRLQIASLDKATAKPDVSQTKASPAKAEMPQSVTVESSGLQPSANCMSVNVSYRNALPASSQVNLAFPLNIPAAITSMFGWRVHPISGVRRFHAGTDFAAPMGTPVLATLPGRVIAAAYMGGYGNAVILEHPDTSQRTLYGHLSTVLVQSGMWVEQGTVIGQVGSTGLSTGPHLHFEVRQLTDDGWAPINPIHSPDTTVAQLEDGGS